MNKYAIIGIGVAIVIAIAITLIMVNQQNLKQENIIVNDKIRIATTTYPLYEFTKRIVGDKGVTKMLIPPGVELHDWEPTARDLERIKGFEILIYNSQNLEPYIVKIRDNINIRLIEASTNLIRNNDPHVWLDPSLAKEQVNNIMNAIINVDPINEAYYRENAKIYIKSLEELDKQFEEGLKNCERREFIVLHTAYQYLADRYNLTMIAIAGLEPEHDIPASKIKEIIDIAKAKNIDVIYAEEGIDKRAIDEIAKEINAKVLILTPIEVINEEELSKGITYIEKMRNNLQNLKIGLRCI